MRKRILIINMFFTFNFFLSKMSVDDEASTTFYFLIPEAVNFLQRKKS
jgi:hypothetical protein